MPKVTNSAIYRATFQAASEILRQQSDDVVGRIRSMAPNQALYRYVSYRDFAGQQEAGGRTVWTPLSQDLDNRWTGSGPDGGGQQGLYFSQEGEGPGPTAFPELQYYQDMDRPVPAQEEVAYYEYRPSPPGQPPLAPEWTKAPASSLRTMFLYTCTPPLGTPYPGLDLTYQGPQDPLMEAILSRARKIAPEAFTDADTVQSLYMASEDASFTRAIGNAALEVGFRFFQTTSVRDRQSVNVVIRARTREPVTTLSPQGRATFFVRPDDQRRQAVVTIDDMLYNDTFDTSTAIVPARDWRAQLAQAEERVAHLAQEIDWLYTARAVDAEIGTETRKYLHDHSDILDAPVHSAVGEVTAATVDGRVVEVLTNCVFAAAAARPDYVVLRQNLAAEGVRSLLIRSLVAPKVHQLAERGYRQSVVAEVLLKERQHHFEETALQLQRAAAAARQMSGGTAAERNAREAELTKVRDQQGRLKPDDPAFKKESERLRQDAEHLEADIKRLADALEAQEREAERIEQERQAAEVEREASRAGEQEAERRHREASEGIFRRERV
ncbi:hypothetical protein EST92_17555 [Streptomyces sp. TM32]|uniref:hypothetical protein n=1 Tax=Streptomyces sp. TM32 TaxID=1652669 RepID=UPI00101252F7|nr:hypothetical protein [Streptomyces sp. TM32]RXS80451.1 hypothetical protein EST92_17555 [Streptomyces sp. TM32]